MRKILKLWWVAAIVVGLIFGLKFWFNQPAVGTTTKAVMPTKTIDDIYEFKGKNFSFKYPSNLELRKQQDDETGSNIGLFGLGMNSIKYNVSLRSNTGQFEEDSGIVMRRAKKNDYQEQTINLNNLSGLVFTSKDGSEITGFFNRGSQILTVSLIGSIGDETKLEKYQNFLEGITF